MKNKLTTKDYWENYYAHNHAKRDHIIGVCSYYDKYWDQFINEGSNGKSIIEIGGFPGRYLSYLSSKYGLRPTCLDFNSDTTQIEDCFNTMGVEDYSILVEDFTTFKPGHQYDFVISMGFIEHFEDFEAILDKHLDYLKPEGKLLVMIPNLRYLRSIYGFMCDYENLKAHNLKSMKSKVFEDFAVRNDLHMKSFNYFGGFPFAVHQKLNLFQYLVYQSFRFSFKLINPYLIKYPSKYLSAGMVGIFEKPNKRGI